MNLTGQEIKDKISKAINLEVSNITIALKEEDYSKVLKEYINKKGFDGVLVDRKQDPNNLEKAIVGFTIDKMILIRKIK